MWVSFGLVAFLSLIPLAKMIVRKFTNYRTQVYLKNSETFTPPQPPSPTGPLFKFSSVLTDRQLFAKDNSASINSVAAQLLTAKGHGTLAPAYQSVLKKM
jgi:hypothetical protein